MDTTHQLIDAQFDRAVEIVQGLPKTGPIQTGYEEKLAMYSLYKQATVGNVKSPRPGMWDMLGRAKWDAWAKQKDLDPHQAKRLYVETLQKVLRKYSDKTVARDLVRELESYTGDPSNMVLSDFSPSSKPAGTSSSRSSGSASPINSPPVQLPPQPQPHPIQAEESTDEEGEEEEEEEEEMEEVVHPLSPPSEARPHSSLSSHLRYRTPIATSTGVPAFSPSSTPGIPLTQPLPRYATPSAFAESTSPIPSSSYPTSVSYPQHLSLSHATSSGIAPTPPHIYPAHPGYRAGPLRQFPPQGPLQQRPENRPPLERAVEGVQASLAALHERLESLESLTGYQSRSIGSPGSQRWSMQLPPRVRESWDGRDWDMSNFGAWSLVLKPLARIVHALQSLAQFLAQNDTSSPVLVIIRRLFLDASFVICVLAVLRIVWRRSGLRRREVKAALMGLWRALVGGRRERIMVDRGV